MKIGLLLLGLAALNTACAVTDSQIGKSEALIYPTLSGQPPIVIAHRGASGDLPEHTLEAYALAIEQGADFIEPDLVMTKDGILIARHDLYLSTTTNVSDRPEFADRRREQQHEASIRPDWWAEDFTLDEIKSLRARQPFESRSQAHDDLYQIPTFDEILALSVSTAKSGHPIGIYPETKSPGHHSNIGLDMVAPLLQALDHADVRNAGIGVYIQSFEPDILNRLSLIADWPLVLLLYGAPSDPDLSEVEFDGVGANKRLLWKPDGTPSDFVERAHAFGLEVHAWTVRDDRVAPRYETVNAELQALFEQGVDGVFVDFPETAINLIHN